MRHLLTWVAMMATLSATGAFGASKDYPVRPVTFTAVQFEDDFWSPRLETNRKVTAPYDFKKCEETGRIDNFAKAGGLMEGKHEGIFFNDSDVFKVVEGAAYSLALHPDPELDKYLDDLIAKFAAAQEDDGYLYTARTIDPKNPARGAGPERWSNTRHGHELYNVGHMYEAAVAHYRATGKRSLLDVAIKNADLIDRVFGPGKNQKVPGHEEIEIGLVKLYRATGEERYLKLAKFFIDERGNAEGHKLYGKYAQDHLPVVEQSEAVGHAVRAGYLYSGMADVAAITGDAAIVAALDRIWRDVVEGKLYVTGSIGARRGGEAFGDAYELPNKTAYNETCAAIANMMWNHRLFLLHGDAKYLDVLERALYNGFLSGISLSGDAFFYPNPLEADGVYKFNQGAATRQPWFGCSCCPSNVVRFLPSLPGYVYAQRGKAVYVNLFVAGGAKLKVGGKELLLKQTTRYPWDGEVKLALYPETPAEFELRVRVPGWARNEVAPGDLYRYATKSEAAATLKVNGRARKLELDKGFARVSRKWNKGDVIELYLPMPVRRVLAHEKVEADAGRVALERGPVVYCAEGIDNGGTLGNLLLRDDAALTVEHRPDLLGGVSVLRGRIEALSREADREVARAERDFLAVPYYAWCHRGVGEMRVWLAREEAAVELPPPSTLATTSRAGASHCWRADTVTALNDAREPKNSSDHGIPRLTWWDHRGGTEWVQYDFAEPAKVSGVEVYWFDDTGRGQCRVPASWRVLYKSGDAWKPVANAKGAGVARDKYNACTFDAVETSALRLEVELQANFSGGILEWRVSESR